MGMVYGLRRATDDQLAMLLRRPQLIEGFLSDVAREEAVIRTGLWDKLASSFGFRRSRSPVGTDREDGDEIDLDKSWHVMHYLLTGSDLGTDDPLSLLQQDWPSIGDIHVGWGPAFAIDSRAIAQFSRAAATVELEHKRHRFDPAAMKAADIYLGDAFDADDDEGFAYIAYYYDILRTFTTDCARRGCGAVGSIT